MNGDFRLVHQGQRNTLTATVTGLTTGLPYRFYVQAENYVDKSIASDIKTVYSCISPSGMDAPIKGTVTTTSVKLYWLPPLDDGGCPLLGYSILRDDGASGNFIEVHASDVNALPSLNQFTVTDLPTTPSGKTVRFRIQAHNIGGHSVVSKTTNVVIASVPGTPGSAPVSDFSATTGSLIKITYSKPDEGGSPILNYEIQMDDGLGNGFYTIAGGDSQIHLYTFFQAQASS